MPYLVSLEKDIDLSNVLDITSYNFIMRIDILNYK